MQAAPLAEDVPNAGGDGLPTVPIDELDFDFVAKCTDYAKLRDILTILESGKEGHYPELIQATIDRLMETLPAKEKKLFVALRSNPTSFEEDEARSSLSDWIGQISKVDAAVQSTSSQQGGAAVTSGQASKEIFEESSIREAKGARGTNLNSRGSDEPKEVLSRVYASQIPVRNQSKSNTGRTDSQVTQQLGSSTASIHNTSTTEPKWSKAKPDPKARDFKSYYDDWDKFDADAELDKLDAVEQAKSEARRAKQQQQEARLKAAADARKLRMEELGISLDPTTMTAEEKTFTADREKRKGNECFKANEFEDAIMYYSRSIFVQPENSIVWANRAMAYLRLKHFDKAEEDCTEAIRLDPTYVKAISRRAMTRHKRGKYRDAAKDYYMAVKMDPSNKTLQTLLQQSRRKFTEVEGLGLDAEQNPVKPEQFKRINIAFEDSSDDDDDSSDDDMPTLSRPSAHTVSVKLPESKAKLEDNANKQEKFKKVVIEEASDSSDDDDDNNNDNDVQQHQRNKEEGEKKQEEGLTKAKAADSNLEAKDTKQSSSSADRIIQDTLVQQSDSPTTAVEKLRARGNAFFAAGDVDLAIATYDQAITLRPPASAASLAACYSNRAAAYLKKGGHVFAESDASAALSHLDTDDALAKTKNPKGPIIRLKVLYRRAVARRAQGKIAAAIKDLRAVLAIQPQNSQAQVMLKEAETELQNIEGNARAAAEAAEARRQDELARERKRKQKLQQVKHAAKTQQSCENTRSLTKNQHQTSSSSLEKDGQQINTPLAHRELMEKLSSAAPTLPQPTKTVDLEKNKSAAVLLKDEGNAAFKANKPDTAVLLYSQAVKLDPTNYVYYLNRAAALLVIETEKSWVECIADASKACELLEKQLETDVKNTKLASSRIKSIFRRASAKEKLMNLEFSRRDTTLALSHAKSALTDVQLALKAAPTHAHMLKMSDRLQQKIQLHTKRVSAVGSGSNSPALSKRAKEAVEKAEKAASLAAKAQAARRQSNGASPAGGTFKTPKTAYAVKHTLASMRYADDAAQQQADYLWQFKTGAWTAKKFFSSGVDVELLGPLVRCLDLYFEPSPKRCISILQKVAACKSASTAAMLLDSNDAAILKRLQKQALETDPNARVNF